MTAHEDHHQHLHHHTLLAPNHPPLPHDQHAQDRDPPANPAPISFFTAVKLDFIFKQRRWHFHFHYCHLRHCLAHFSPLDFPNFQDSPVDGQSLRVRGKEKRSVQIKRGASTYFTPFVAVATNICFAGLALFFTLKIRLRLAIAREMFICIWTQSHNCKYINGKHLFRSRGFTS